MKNGLNLGYLQSILNTLSSQNERYIRSRHFPAHTPQGKFILLTEKVNLLTTALRFMGLVSFHSTSPLLPFLPSWVFCSGLAGLLAVSHPNQEPRVCGLRAGFSLCPFLCLLFVAVVIVSLLSYVWLCDPMDCSPPGSSVHGIFQARILEWVAIYSSRGASWLRNRTHVSSLRLSYLGSPNLLEVCA